jgi:hypothetical protein
MTVKLRKFLKELRSGEQSYWSIFRPFGRQLHYRLDRPRVKYFLEQKPMGSSKTVETPNPFANCLRRWRRSFDKCQILLVIIILLLCKIINDIQTQNAEKIEEFSHPKRHFKNLEAVIEDEKFEKVEGNYQLLFENKIMKFVGSYLKKLRDEKLSLAKISLFFSV